MKKLITLLLALFLFSGCAEKTYDNTLDRVLGEGKLVVSTSPDYPPYEFIDANGEIKGLEMEMAAYIASELGVDLEIKPLEFSMAMSAVDTGISDIVISGLGYKPEREESMELTNIYNSEEGEACHGFLVLSEKLDSYKTLEDFNGLLIGVQANSLQETYAKEQLSSDTILESFTTLDIGVLSLQSGKYDVIASSCPLAIGYANADSKLAHPEIYFDMSEVVNSSGYVAGAKKGETEFINEVNRIIAQAEELDLFKEWTVKAEEDALNIGIDVQVKEDTNVNPDSKGILEVFIENYDVFFDGLLITLGISLVAVVCGTLLGALIACLQYFDNKVLNIILKIYINIIRGTPLLVQLYIFYLFLPMAIPSLNNLPKEIFIILGLIINSSAYVAEIIRGGINAVDKGQTEAARSLGMSKHNCMIKIILPQAIKNILPALGNEYITMIKESSIASALSVGELMYTRTILGNQFLFWQPLFIIAIIYLIVTSVLTKVVSIMERRLSVSD